MARRLPHHRWLRDVALAVGLAACGGEANGSAPEPPSTNAMPAVPSIGPPVTAAPSSGDHGAPAFETVSTFRTITAADPLAPWLARRFSWVGPTIEDTGDPWFGALHYVRARVGEHDVVLIASGEPPAERAREVPQRPTCMPPAPPAHPAPPELAILVDGVESGDLPAGVPPTDDDAIAFVRAAMLTNTRSYSATSFDDADRVVLEQAWGEQGRWVTSARTDVEGTGASLRVRALYATRGYRGQHEPDVSYQVTQLEGHVDDAGYAVVTEQTERYEGSPPRPASTGTSPLVDEW